MTDAGERPCRRQIVEALLWAACLALLFLRGAALPTRACVPVCPEVYEPLRSEVLARGEFTAAELDAGNATMGDKYNQSLCWDRILQDRLRSFELPLWTRDIGGGVPFVPQMAQVFQPWNLLLAVLPIPSCGIYGIWLFLHLSLLGFFAWWFARRLGIAHTAALLALVGVEIGFWAQARVHHNVILSAALPLFPLLTMVDGAFRRAPLTRARIALFGVLSGLSWSGGFAPVSLQTTGLVVLFAAYRAIELRTLRPLPGIFAGLLLGGVLALPQMGPTLLASTLSSRPTMTDAELQANGLTFDHLRTLLFPDLLNWPDARSVGGATAPPWTALEELDYGRAARFNFPETAFAFGVPGLVLALCALRRPARLSRLWFAVAVLAFGLATANQPFLTLAHLIPGARAGDLRRFLYLVAMTLPLLAADGADRTLLLARDRLGAAIALLFAVVAASGLARVLIHGGDPESFRAWFADRLVAAHPEVPRAMVLDAMQVRPFETPNNLSALTLTHGRTLLVAVATAALCLFARGGARLRGLAALTAIELCHAGAGTIVAVDTARVERMPRLLGPVVDATHAAEAEHAARPRLQRIDTAAGSTSRLLPPNLAAFHGLEDLARYDPLPSARSEQLFDALEARTPDATGQPRTGASLGGAGVGPLRHPESIHHALLDLLGCRFVIARRDQLDLVGEDLVDRTPADAGGPFALVERLTTLPRATFVDRVTVEPDATRRLALLADPHRDFRRETILEDATAIDPHGDGVGDADVRVVAHDDESVRIDVEAREAGYLRLADPFDPGWTATVDGASAAVLCADHDCRAVYLAAGRHQVEFRYDSFVRVRIWNLLGSIGLLAALFLWRTSRRAEAA